MKSNKTKRKLNLTWSLLLLLILVINYSCSKDDTLEDIIDSSSSIKIEQADKAFFSQIKKAGVEYDKNEIWNGYTFSSTPMYFIFRDKDKKAVRGYLINPPKAIIGATKITGDNAQGLNVYRYDKDAKKLNEDLKKGNDAYTFDFVIDGTKYYGQEYTEKSVNDKLNGAILLGTHEVFHTFQFKNWTLKQSAIQDEKNYPINKDLLALQIMTLKIAAKMPKITDKAEVKKYLKMYVAIRAKELKTDPSSQKLVLNMANEQENGEGTARYVETMVGYKIISDFKATFGGGENTSELTKKEDVRQFFAFGIWYSTGGAVTYMLKNQGLKIEETVAKGKTLYDIAKEYVNLTDVQLATAFQNAKTEFGWDAIQKEAKRLADL